MSSQNYIVPARSWDNIGQIADTVRIQFSLSDEPNFPVMDFLERVLFQRMGVLDLRIRAKSEMGDFEGFTDPKGQFIVLREDVYENAWDGNGRDRFTVAHELGHFFLHTGIPMARAHSEVTVKPFRLSEPQANQFAAELLMPRQFMQSSDDVQTIINRHCVSLNAAANRLRFISKKRENEKGVRN